MDRDEAEKLNKPELVNLVIQQQEAIDNLRGQLSNVAVAETGTIDRYHQHRSHHHHRPRRRNSILKKTWSRTILIITLGTILTVLIVLAMTGYLWVLIDRLMHYILSLI